jgi:hypothetical protein
MDAAELDPAELALLVDSELEVQVMMETEVQVMVHCLVILHPLPNWFPLLPCNLVGVGRRIRLA